MSEKSLLPNGNQTMDSDVESAGSSISELKNTKKIKYLVIAFASIFALIFIVLLVIFALFISSYKSSLLKSTRNEVIPISSIAILKERPVFQSENIKSELNEPYSSSTTKTLLALTSRVIQQPGNHTVSKGGSVTMPCKFERAVECRWLRRSTEVEISGRYKYEESEASDCSFTIHNFRQLDVGEWVCVGVLEDRSRLHSDASQLNLAPPTLGQLSPSDQNVSLGARVTLDCRFAEPVECVWLRRGEHVEIRGRYSYVSPAAPGRLTTDCSISIEAVRSIDRGSWVCSTMADSNSQGASHPPAYITII